MSEEFEYNTKRKKEDKADKPAKPHLRQSAVPLLTEVEIEALRSKAKEEVADDYKEIERQQVYKRLLAEERGRFDPEEELAEVLIDLPGHSNRIVINGVEYFHGGTYTVSVSLLRAFQEIMARAWDHEDNVGGANRDKYKPPSRGIRVGNSGTTGFVPRSQDLQGIMRA